MHNTNDRIIPKTSKMGLFNFKKKENEKLPYEAQLYLLAISALQNNEFGKLLDLFNELIQNNINQSDLAEHKANLYYNRSIAKTQLQHHRWRFECCK
jgi:hypothetical protein